jgi:hypothetical protein
MRQVGIRKTIAVEVSKLIQTASKPGYVFDLGMSLTGYPFTGQVVPGMEVT